MISSVTYTSYLRHRLVRHGETRWRTGELLQSNTLPPLHCKTQDRRAEWCRSPDTKHRVVICRLQVTCIQTHLVPYHYFANPSSGHYTESVSLVASNPGYHDTHDLATEDS